MAEQIINDNPVGDEITEELEQTEGEEAAVEDNRFDFSKRNQLKTKSIPAITTLLAGAVVSISTFVNRFELIEALKYIFIAMLIFYFAGEIIKFIADRFIIESEKDEIPSDGEVIEKTPEENEEVQEE